jgi:diacylglycerol kinase family enzyme
MAEPRTLVVVNPAAKRARNVAAETLKSSFARHGMSVDVEISRTPDTVAQGARDRGYDRVVAGGGDGTLRSVACLAGLPVGLLPIGTSNSVARSLGIPLGLDSAIAAIAKGSVRTMDLGLIRGPRIEGGSQRFILCASVGLDAESARLYELTARHNPSVARYCMTVGKAMIHYTHPPISVLTDSRQEPFLARNVVATNMKIYAGFFILTPDAHPFDGLLDFVGIRSEGSMGMLGNLTRGWLRRPQLRSRTYIEQTQHCIWESEGDVPVEIDGEPIGYLPAEVSVEQAAIEFILPSDLS